MAKILLVEDDKSLREIYGVRLMAEGYEIVSAGDGEEALAMAIKERPDLIVSDVMMPKISGFDMLDILRSTSETKNVKVIMMTALSSDDQRARGEALGADRYLVKSQVGIEDVVRTVHDVLGDSLAAPTSAVPTFSPEPTPVGNPEPQASAPAPVITDPLPASAEAPVPVAPVVATPVIDSVLPTPVPTPAPITAAVPEPRPVAPVFEARPTAPVQPRPVEPTPVTQAIPAPNPAPAPTVPTPAPAPVIDPVFTPAPTPITPAPVAPAPAPVPASTTLTELPTQAPTPVPAPAPAPVPAPLPQPTAPFSSPAPASLGERVIEPLTNPAPAQTVDIASQIAQELNNSTFPGQGTPPTL